MSPSPAKSGEHTPPTSAPEASPPEVQGAAEPKSAARDAERRPRPRSRRWGRWLLVAGLSSLIFVLLLWVAVHRIPWMGPLVANSLRAVIGTDNVARLEDFVYGLEDRFNRTFKKNQKPKAYWDVKSARQALPKPPKPANSASRAVIPPFTLPDPGPVHESWSAPGDGQWVPLIDPRRPDDEVRMLKTLLHPDKNRSWSDLFVVAVDLRRVNVHPMAGYQEPKSDKPQAQEYKRLAKIPEKHHESLLAAFNGGFMTEHGGYGMKIDGVTLVDPKPKACTLASYESGRLGIGPWTALAERESEMLWYRQAPNCMYVDGEMHPLLKAPNIRHWGATLDGDTVIRRSAVGMAEAGDTLYVGISNHTTARVMAEGMRHAGATTVAQMDVNWSYPKFVLYEPKGETGKLIATALVEGFEFSEDEYIRSRSMRDFFYLTRKDEPESRGTEKP